MTCTILLTSGYVNLTPSAPFCPYKTNLRLNSKKNNRQIRLVTKKTDPPNIKRLPHRTTTLFLCSFDGFNLKTCIGTQQPKMKILFSVFDDCGQSHFKHCAVLIEGFNIAAVRFNDFASKRKSNPRVALFSRIKSFENMR